MNSAAALHAKPLRPCRRRRYAIHPGHAQERISNAGVPLSNTGEKRSADRVPSSTEGEKSSKDRVRNSNDGEKNSKDRVLSSTTGEQSSKDRVPLSTGGEKSQDRHFAGRTGQMHQQGGAQECGCDAHTTGACGIAAQKPGLSPDALEFYPGSPLSDFRLRKSFRRTARR